MRRLPARRGTPRRGWIGLNFAITAALKGASPVQTTWDLAIQASWNLFSYGLNNPLRFSDPSGHEPCENGVNPENGNICVVKTDQAPKVDPAPSGVGILDLSWTFTKVVLGSANQGTQPLIQGTMDDVSLPRDPGCMAGYVATGSGVGFWAGGGLGMLGFAGGPAAAVTIPGGAAGGASLGGTVGGLGGLVMCVNGSGTGGGGAASQPSGDGFWKGPKSFRGKTKTNGLQGKAKRFFEWDHTHGDVEVYDGRGRHLGSADPNTGAMTKLAVAGGGASHYEYDWFLLLANGERCK